MALSIEEQVLRLDVAMGDALRMEVGDALEDLLERAFDLTGRHAALLDGGIEVASGTELHDLAPALLLVLHQVDGLDDVDMVKSRRDAELCSQLLDVLFLSLVLAALAELLWPRSAHGGL
jgi:hypothetical protein